MTNGLGTGENRTLGCGYLDVVDSIFKNEGVDISMIDDLTVKCTSNHLTSFGVEEYTGDGSSPDDIALEDRIIEFTVEETAVDRADKAFCLWASTGSFVLLMTFAIWGYFKDKRDEKQYELLRDPAKKLLVGLFLEPNPEKKKAKKLPPKDEDEDDFDQVPEVPVFV